MRTAEQRKTVQSAHLTPQSCWMIYSVNGFNHGDSHTQRELNQFPFPLQFRFKDTKVYRAKLKQMLYKSAALSYQHSNRSSFKWQYMIVRLHTSKRLQDSFRPTIPNWNLTLWIEDWYTSCDCVPCTHADYTADKNLIIFLNSLTRLLTHDPEPHDKSFALGWTIVFLTVRAITPNRGAL